MKSKLKIIAWVFVPIVTTALIIFILLPDDYGLRTMLRAAPIGTGYAAKMLCSGVFSSGREADTVWNEDLDLMKNNKIEGRVDYENKFAEAYVMGFLFKQRAYYRENCGCTLDIDVNVDEFLKQCDGAIPPAPAEIKSQPWPMGDAAPVAASTAEIDVAQIERTLDWAFTETSEDHPMRTRAAIVIYDGQIVAERYGKGITKDTRLLGWSMSKSAASALIGALVGQGKLDVAKPAPVPEWKSPGDPRGAITLDQLLRMSGGIEFVEEYTAKPDSDAGFMYFTMNDMAAFAARKPLIHKPGEKFSYSSGTTMLLARIVRQTVGGSFADYLSFTRRELFNKLGMRSAVIEPDPSGTMVGAGFMYATARDWARFGILYYNDGVWNGERILPEGWAQYSRTPSSSNPRYGAQWWLNTDGWLPNCPTDIYSAWGYEGQFVTIIPSRKTIIVRLGQTTNAEKYWDHDYFISNVLKGVP